MIAAADVWWEVDNRSYHGETDHVSHSSLEVFRRSSLEYHETYVSKALPRREPSEEMALGTALHVLLSERERWGELMAVRPDVDRRTRLGKEQYAAFLAAADGRTVIDQDQFATVNRMVEALQRPRYKTARDLLAADGVYERSIQWEDAASGVRCKCRFDKLLTDGIILDIKTASEPSPAAWLYGANRYGYHRQAALYLDGFAAKFNRPVMLLYIVFGTKPPYEIGVFSWKDKSLSLGRAQNLEDLARLARCRESGEWDSPWTLGIQGIELPRFAFGPSGADALEQIA